jgi:hypothetical protein
MASFSYLTYYKPLSITPTKEFPSYFTPRIAQFRSKVEQNGTPDPLRAPVTSVLGVFSDGGHMALLPADRCPRTGTCEAARIPGLGVPWCYLISARICANWQPRRTSETSASVWPNVMRSPVDITTLDRFALERVSKGWLGARDLRSPLRGASLLLDGVFAFDLKGNQEGDHITRW